MGRRPPFTWTRLHLPVPTSLDWARAAITAIAGISGQPRVVLEVAGRGGAVSWKLGCDAHETTRILTALATHLPGLRPEPLSSSFDGLRADTVAAIRLAGGHRLPLHRDNTFLATRGLLGALAQTNKGESVYVQLVLGPRTRPTRPAEADVLQRRAVTIKHSEHQFGCLIRVAARTTDPARSRSLIGSAIGALRGLEVPGVRIRVVRSSVQAFSAASSPFLWPNTLSISDVVPFTGWPVTNESDPALPGVPARHPKLLSPTEKVPQRGRPLGVATAPSSVRPVAISADDSLRHLHLLGPTGVGKSTLMAHLALDDISRGRGVVVIDPKGDLVDDILARLDERRLDDVVLLDARDDAPVGINGLTGGDPDLAADTLLGVFHSLYADSWGPRTHDILHASLLTLARRGDASLVMVPLLLTNPGFRRSVVGRLVKHDPMGLGSFWSWYEAISEGERSQAIAPLMNKLRPVLMRPGIRAVLGQRRPRFDLLDIFTKRRILLVSLAKGVIGPEAAQLLGSLVVSQFWTTAQGRAGLAPERRHPVMVHIDEVQDYLRLPGDLGDALAQARGLGVGFTLAHQHLDQLPKGLRAAVLTNARSRVTFQLSQRDARELAAGTGGALATEDFQALPAYQAYASILSGGSPSGWVSLTTQPLTHVVRDPNTVRARSRARYGQPMSDIEAELLEMISPSRPADEQIGRARHADGGRHD
jgi:hypothetical protein